MFKGAITLNLDGALGGVSADLRTLLIGMRVLAALADDDAITDAREAAGAAKRFDDDDEDTTAEAAPWSEYDAAIQRMIEEAAITAAQAERARIILSAMRTQAEDLFFGTTLPNRQFAIFNILSDGLQNEFTKAVESAIKEGASQAEFLGAIDEAISDDVLPFGMDPYLENVYRTESANAMAAQRDDLLADPDLEPYLWGYEFFNPDDDRSRDSHAKMNGVKIRKGGAADQLNKQLGGGPPWSYQCRCVKAPIIVSDPGSTDARETDGAEELIRRVDRF